MNRKTDNNPKLTIEQLIGEHYESLYRYAFRLSGQAGDAEDLTQQTFLTAHRKLSQLREPAAARGWLFQVLRTTFLKSCRKRRPMVATDVELPLTDVAIDPAHDSQHDGERLQQKLLELPEVYRVALLMFYFEEKSYRDIATELGIAPGTVMSRLYRAKSQLKSRMLNSRVNDHVDV